MPTIANQITEVFTEKADQIVTSALALKGGEGEPSLISLVNWEDPTSPQGFEEEIEVSANASAGTYAKGGNFPAAGRAEHVDQIIAWSRYVFVVEATGTQLAQLELAESLRMTKIKNFLMKQMRSGTEAVTDVMEGHLLTNTPSLNSDGFTGLEFIASPTNTYGGVNATTYGNTGCAVTTVGGALTMSAMDTLTNSFKSSKQGKYNVVLTSYGQRQKYEDLTAGTGSVPAGQSITSTQLDGTDRVFSAGFTSHFYRNRPVVALQDYATDAMDFLDSRNLKGTVLQDWETKVFHPEADRVRWVVKAQLAVMLQNRGKALTRLDGLT